MTLLTTSKQFPNKCENSSFIALKYISLRLKREKTYLFTDEQSFFVADEV